MFPSLGQKDLHIIDKTITGHYTVTLVDLYVVHQIQLSKTSLLPTVLQLLYYFRIFRNQRVENSVFTF